MELRNFEDFSATYKSRIEQLMEKLVRDIITPKVLKESMSYSLMAGGKRIRPLILLATIDALNGNVEKGLKTACAVEMIHTYSLIHDDLPCMDNDDYRRGKLTNHKMFGEAVALLAGDALLTHAFTIISKQVGTGDITAEQAVKIIASLSECSGAAGMVGGQMEDINGENKQLTLKELEYIHTHKTGKLLEASILAGAYIANANQEQIELLRQFAKHIGLAFQIKDDILDIEGNEEELGKKVGGDVERHKSTYPSLMTLEGAKEELDKNIYQAKTILLHLNLFDSYLANLTDLIANRSN